MKVKYTIKGSSQFRVKCAGLWTMGTAGLWEGHRGLPHPVGTDQISKHRYPPRDQGSNSRAEVDFCKIHCHISVIFQAYWIVLDLIFMPPLPFFSCCLESVVVEINPRYSNWIRIRVSSLKFSFFFFFLIIISLFAWSIVITLPYPFLSTLRSDGTTQMQKVIWSQ